MKIIIWDIETSPIIVSSWGIYKPYLTHDNIERHGNILTASWKEVGKGKVNSVSVSSKTPTDDLKLVIELAANLSSADVLVAHNGNAFDVPWLNARLAFHGLPPLPPIKTVDTCLVARKQFRFECNKLDFLGEYLGLGKKIKTSYSLWKDVLAGDEKALKRMIRYNEQDVKLLEKVYLRLRPFMPHHPNQALSSNSHICPTCGIGKLEKRGIRTLSTTSRQRYHCLNPKCRAWSYGTEQINRTKVTS